MKLSKAFCAVILAVLLLPVGSCQSFQRFSKDFYVTVTSPGLILMGASADAYTGAVEVRKGYQAGGATEVISFVPLFFYNFLKHTCYCLVYALDMPLTLFYGISEAAEFGPEIEQIDYYNIGWLDKPWWGEGSSTDAESGEKK